MKVVPRTPGPAYENLQRRKPREGVRGPGRGLYGDLAGVRLDEVGLRRPLQSLCLAGWELGDGLNERSGRCWTGLGGATAGRFIDLRQAWAVLAESQPEWRASLGWWVGADGIMRCRS